jgi:hypothetical protein
VDVDSKISVHYLFGKAEHPRQGFPKYLKCRIQFRNFLFCPGNWSRHFAARSSMELLTKFKSAIVEFDVTQSQLGAYADMKNSRVSRGMTGEIPFDAAESKLIDETITAMRDLQSAVRPEVPIAWAVIHKVKPLVDQRRRELREQTDPVVRRCTLIRITFTGFFLRVRGGQVLTTPSEMTAAAFEDHSVASEVVRELKKLGTEARIESFGAFRRESTMSRTLASVGLEEAKDGTGNYEIN